MTTIKVILNITVYHLGNNGHTMCRHFLSISSCNDANMILEVVRAFKSPFVSSKTWKTGCVIKKACIFAQFTTDGVNITLTGRACMSSIRGTSSFADTKFFHSTPIPIHFHGYVAKCFVVVAQGLMYCMVPFDDAL